MSLDSPQAQPIDATRFRFGVVAACFNEQLVNGLLSRLAAVLHGAGVNRTAVELIRVPGSHEVPWAAHQLAASGRVDCVVGLGVLIGGDTNHHEMVGHSVSLALQQVALGTGIPVINGVIVTNTLAQARARCTGRINRGAEFGHAALAMAALRRARKGKKS